MSLITDALNSAISDTSVNTTALVENLPTVKKVNSELDFLIPAIGFLILINGLTLYLVFKSKK